MAIITKQEMEKLIKERPSGVTPEEIVIGLQQKGHKIEGLAMDAEIPEAKEEGQKGFDGFATGFTKSMLGTARNVAGGLQGFGQRILASITPGKTLQDIESETGIKSISNKTPEGQAVKEILTPKGRTEKVGAGVEQVAEFLVPGSKVAKATEKAGQVLKTTGQIASDVAVTAAQEGDFDSATKTGITTGILSNIPIVGKLVKSKLAPVTEDIAKRIEQINLRLTPVQKTALKGKENNVISYLAKKKITGTPEARYDKILNLVDEFEGKVQTAIKDSGKKYTKNEIINEINLIPEKYLEEVDNPEVYAKMQKDVNAFVNFIKKQPGEEIDAARINKFKRNYAKNARNKAGDTVTNESREAISDGLYLILQRDIENLKPINKEYANILESKKLLGKALGRNELGLIGNIISITAGSSVGGAIGGPVGAAAGGAVGPQIAKTFAGTSVRSQLGAGLQTLSEYLAKAKTTKKGNFIIPRSIINSLMSDTGED